MFPNRILIGWLGGCCLCPSRCVQWDESGVRISARIHTNGKYERRLIDRVKSYFYELLYHCGISYTEGNSTGVNGICCRLLNIHFVHHFYTVGFNYILKHSGNSLFVPLSKHIVD